MRITRMLCPMLIFVVGGVVGHVYNLLQSGSSVPRLVAKEIRDQESARGTSLDVYYQYQMGLRDRPSRPCFVHYMRTPERAFVQIALKGLSITASFDRVRKEYNQLSVTSLGHSDGRISHEIGVPFDGTATVMDVFWLRLGSATLADIVEKGRLISREKIDGHQCWKISSSFDSGGGIFRRNSRCLIWVDPMLGFAPRKIEIREDKQQPRTLVFTQYKAVGAGIWFPMVIADGFMLAAEQHGANADTGQMGLLCRATQVRVGQALPSATMRVVIPSGIEVRDDIQGKTVQAK